MNKFIILSALLMTVSTSSFAHMPLEGEFNAVEFGSATLNFHSDNQFGELSIDISDRKFESNTDAIGLQVNDIGTRLGLGRVTNNKAINASPKDNLIAVTEKEINKALNEGFQIATNGEAKLETHQIHVSQFLCTYKKQTKLFKKSIETTTCSMIFERDSIYSLK